MTTPTSNLENDQDLSIKDEKSSETLYFVNWIVVYYLCSSIFSSIWFILLLIGCDWGYLSRGLSLSDISLIILY